MVSNVTDFGNPQQASKKGKEKNKELSHSWKKGYQRSIAPYPP